MDIDDDMIIDDDMDNADAAAADNTLLVDTNEDVDADAADTNNTNEYGLEAEDEDEMVPRSFDYPPQVVEAEANALSHHFRLAVTEVLCVIRHHRDNLEAAAAELHVKAMALPTHGGRSSLIASHGRVLECRKICYHQHILKRTRALVVAGSPVPCRKEVYIVGSLPLEQGWLK
mmetsp:Transcript_23854/g.51887  ORF Transcript_23854/g.51887 Transcript_23854/m.51887 type:complete len:174 (+) Transcript_23854:98-619(+)